MAIPLVQRLKRVADYIPLNKGHRSHAYSEVSELMMNLEVLEVENGQLREQTLEYRSRLISYRQREEEILRALERTRAFLAIEISINEDDRVKEAREMLGRMAEEVQDVRQARAKSERRIGELEEKLKKRSRRRRTRLGNLPVEARDSRWVSSSLREMVIARDGGMCRYCGKALFPEEIHIDHVWPHSRGGPTSIENLVVACALCNSMKADRIGVWPKPLVEAEEAGQSICITQTHENKNDETD